MGMFDSFYCRAKCPYCKIISEIEFQTKVLQRALAGWKTGEKFEMGDLEVKEGIIHNVYGTCNSKKCLKRNARKGGYQYSGGSLIYADIRIKKGKVMGAANIRKEYASGD